MLTITLQRTKEYSNITKPPKGGRVYKIEGATIGELTITDSNGAQIFKCATLENAGPSTDTPNLDKRIVARTYQLYYTDSSVALPAEYKPRAISTYTSENPNHKARRIHIHIGNYPQDTEGCLLLGYADNGNGTIAQSTKAVKDFYDLIQKHGIDNFRLEIKEIVNA